MQKIYVLLRQDRQTGPYSLEEIIQFDLKPYDLIWIQGGSAGWYYPQEIAALHPYLRFLPKKPQPVNEAKPTFVTAPTASQPVETPAPVFSASKPEETRNNMQTPASAAALEEAVYAQFRKQPETVATGTGSQAAAPTKKRPVNAAVVGLTTILVVGGVFAASWLLNRKESIAAETPMELAAGLPSQAETTSDTDQSKNPSSTPLPSSSVQKKARKSVQPNQSAATTRTTVPVSVVPSTIPDEPVAERTAPPNTEDEPPVVVNDEAVGEDAGSDNSAPVEKKKKLRDRLFDLFKKKPETSGQDESQPSENRSGERTASRREEGANLAQMVHVRFTVPNEWMMGIHGAKATLVNRSNETIQKATVEVQYFDDDDQLLQKKIISFEKVGRKDSRTVPIPDHPTATKVDYSVVSVSGKPAA